MKAYIKKTFEILVDREPYLQSLMAAINFKEVERVATGGMQSACELIMTFEGLNTDFHTDNYIEIKSSSAYSTYYSLNCLNGFYTEDFEKFKKEHHKKNVKFEVKSFNPSLIETTKK